MISEDLCANGAIANFLKSRRYSSLFITDYMRVHITGTNLLAVTDSLVAATSSANEAKVTIMTAIYVGALLLKFRLLNHENVSSRLTPPSGRHSHC